MADRPRVSRLARGFVALGLFSGLVWLAQVPAWQLERRARNERIATAQLRSLASAQADFRGNDRDGNGVLDFWTGDVAGLATYGLIDVRVAKADLRPLLPLVSRPEPFHGYYFAALDADESVSPPEPYRQATDATSGRVHHLARFGFVAIPVDDRQPVVFINEGNSMRAWRWAWTRRLVWPSDDVRRSCTSSYG